MNELSGVIHLLVAALASHFAFTSARKLSSEFLSALFFGGYAVIYGIAPLFLEFGGDGDVLFLTAIASLLALLGALGGRAMARAYFGPAASINMADLTGPKSLGVIVPCGLIGVLGMAFLAYGAAGSLPAYIASGRFEFRLNPANPVMYIAGQYMAPFIGVPPLILVSRPKTRALGFALGLVTAIFAFYFLKGTRSIAIGILLGVFVLAAIGAQRRQGRKPHGSKRGLLALLAGGLLALIVMPNMYQARHALGTADVSPVEALFGMDNRAIRSGENLLVKEPLNYSEFLASAVRVFPSQRDFLWLYPMRRLLFFPLPSGELKPPDTNRVFAQSIGLGSGSTTIPPSLPGEGYVVLGGVAGSGLWAVLYGLGLGWWESRMFRTTASLLALAVGFPVILLAQRGQFYEIVMQVVITFVLASCLIRLIRPDGAKPKGLTVATSSAEALRALHRGHG